MVWSTLLMGICGIFYTSLGGIKAVVWTDFIQGLMMYSGMIVILIKVFFDYGCFSNLQNGTYQVLFYRQLLMQEVLQML